MVHEFLRFYGLPNEDSERFLENLEFIALIKDKNAQEVLLQVLSLCLLGEAKTWLRAFTAGFEDGLGEHRDPE